MKIATETAEAVQYLHEEVKPPIIHRDLKCSNILLGDGHKVKLSDFGFAVLGPTGDETFVQIAEDTPHGTEGYCDPSYMKTGKLIVKYDIYSFGIILLELITGKRCFDVRRSDDKKYLIESEKASFHDMNKFRAEFVDPLLKEKYPVNELEAVVALVENCIEEDSDDRLTIGSVVKALKEITTSQSDQAQSSITS